MRVDDTEISCGVQKLVGLSKRITSKEIDNALADFNNNWGFGAFVYTSVRSTNIPAIRSLKNKGFEIVMKSDDETLLLKTMTYKEKNRLAHKYRKEHPEDYSY